MLLFKDVAFKVIYNMEKKIWKDKKRDLFEGC